MQQPAAASPELVRFTWATDVLTPMPTTHH